MMEAVSVYMRLFETRRSHDAVVSRRKRACSRRKRLFARRQTQERLIYAFMLSMFALNLHSPVRSLWAKERSTYWWEQVVNRTFTPYDWLENFRVEQRVALTLWFLSTNADYRTIGHLFGVSKSTVCLVTKDVCTAIVRVLLPKYIKIPSGDSLKDVVDGCVHKWEFPPCIGAVDGTHIPIKSPEECPADYYNRKGWHSVIMQGMVNHLGHFADVYIGWPGRVHDAGVFANSTLYKRGQDCTLFPDWKKSISGTDVPLVILGDLAYPLLPWLMKAFPDNGNSSHQQKTFNYRLSRARVIVEHAYGRLKGRWRCLLKRLDVSVCDVPKLVAACCVLHNICEIHGESFDEEWMQGVEDSVPANNISTVEVVESGKDIRQALTLYFNEE